MVTSSEEPSWQEQLYEAQAAHFVLYGRAIGLSHAEAEDLLQETFLALTQLEQEPDNPHYYALRAYRNRARNYRRRLWRRLRREQESAGWFEAMAGECPRERAAMHGLKRLPQKQREVIVLKIWHQHTFEAIGELLGISPHTAAGRYRYGMQKLKSHLTAQDHESLEFSRNTVAFVESPSSIGTR